MMFKGKSIKLVLGVMVICVVAIMFFVYSINKNKIIIYNNTDSIIDNIVIKSLGGVVLEEVPIIDANSKEIVKLNLEDSNQDVYFTYYYGENQEAYTSIDIGKNKRNFYKVSIDWIKDNGEMKITVPPY